MFTVPRQLEPGDQIEEFECGVALVDDWVRKRAAFARKAGTAVVYATFCDGVLAGFYSLSSQSIMRDAVPGWIVRNSPEQIPVILLGMMGVDKRFQGCGLGRDLLLDAVHRAESVAAQIGARALVVDPVDDSSNAFYAAHGFRCIPGSDRMFAKLV